MQILQCLVEWFAVSDTHVHQVCLSKKTVVSSQVFIELMCRSTESFDFNWCLRQPCSVDHCSPPPVGKYSPHSYVLCNDNNLAK